MSEPQSLPPREKHFAVKLLSRQDISHDLWTLRIERPADFRFLAGQYATLGLEIDGKRIERAYSIVSSPYEESLEFFAELVPHGELSPHFHKLQPGDWLSCRKIAKGRFTLDLRSGRTNHLLLATVAGIAPYVSYVRTLYRDWKDGNTAMPGNHKLFCVHGASRSWEFGYREELERIAAEAPWFRYVPSVSRPAEDAAWPGETGRVETHLLQFCERWKLKPEETSAYLCGHPQMIENCRGLLQGAGWQKGTIFEEAYFQTGSEAGREE
jgi:ferredoxin/flavodoxin---NADP+ reductase